MIRMIVGGLLMVVLAPGLLAQSTKTLLQKADSLIAQRAYESAFQALGPSNEDETLVVKKTEICLNDFVQSLNHQAFAFKDFTAGDTFDQLRSGTGTYTLHPFDPAAVIGKLLASGKKSPALYKALGDYYYEVSRHYQGRWLLSDAEVAQKAVENYEAAVSKGVRDTATLTNYADKAVELGNFPRAAELYKLALQADPTLVNAAFNLAYSSLRLGNYPDALTYGDQAVAAYRSDPNYRMDALLLCSDAAYLSGDYARSLTYLGRAREISQQEYRVFQKQAYAHLAQGNLAAADQDLDRLFALAPTNPGATQMVTAALEAFGKNDRIPLFFVRNLPQYGSSPEAQANLYFHQALDFEGRGDKTQARKAAASAKAKFLEAGKYDDQIKNALEALVARNS